MFVLMYTKRPMRGSLITIGVFRRRETALKFARERGHRYVRVMRLTGGKTYRL